MTRELGLGHSRPKVAEAGGPHGHGRHAMRRKLQTGKNHKTETSCPVIGFSRRETIVFDVRLWAESQVLSSTPLSRASSFCVEPRRPRRAAPDPRHGRPPCNARVTAELHMQARRSRTSFAGQRHAPHPSAMARRAAAALHKGDSSARSFPAALHDIHLDGCRWPRS